MKKTYVMVIVEMYRSSLVDLKDIMYKRGECALFLREDKVRDGYYGRSCDRFSVEVVLNERAWRLWYQANPRYVDISSCNTLSKRGVLTVCRGVLTGYSNKHEQASAIRYQRVMDALKAECKQCNWQGCDGKDSDGNCPEPPF